MRVRSVPGGGRRPSPGCGTIVVTIRCSASALGVFEAEGTGYANQLIRPALFVRYAEPGVVALQLDPDVSAGHRVVSRSIDKRLDQLGQAAEHHLVTCAR